MTTGKEVTRRFEVAEQTDKYAWLEVLSGKNERVQIPVSPTDQLNGIDEGVEIRVTLKSLNERNTAWRLETIHD